MENFDKNLIITGAILFATFYLFYRSMFKFKKLTNFQQQNRWQIINKQLVILVCLLGFSYGFDYILKNFLYEFFISIIQIQVSQDSFILSGFGLISSLLILFNFKINSYIDSKDERIVNITQEATFANFIPKPREVKPIRFYSHFFNGISLERSAKDYTIQNVKLNIDLKDIQTFKTEQEEQAVKINNFYKRLIDYVNSKASLFNYLKIEQFEIEECNNMLDLKILIFNRFQNLTNKQYFASISQLFQIANNDETEFLSFLRDSQHNRFSSTALKHASLIFKNGSVKMSKIVDNNKFRVENQTQIDIDEIKLINMISSNSFFLYIFIGVAMFNHLYYLGFTLFAFILTFNMQKQITKNKVKNELIKDLNLISNDNLNNKYAVKLGTLVKEHKNNYEIISFLNSIKKKFGFKYDAESIDSQILTSSKSNTITPVLFSDKMLKDHTALMATSGGGKTELLMNAYIESTIARGGGVFCVFGKSDNIFLQKVQSVAAKYNRLQDVLIYDFAEEKSGKTNSNTINMFELGNAKNIITTLVSIANFKDDTWGEGAKALLTSFLKFVLTLRDANFFIDISTNRYCLQLKK